MSYLGVIPARVSEWRHHLDNVVEGKLEIAGTEHRFRTRTHIIKVINRNYQNVGWKPAIGEDVLADGQMSRDLLILDAIEPQPLWQEAERGHSDMLSRLAERLHSSKGHQSGYKRHDIRDSIVTRLNQRERATIEGKSAEVIIFIELSSRTCRIAQRAYQGGKNIEQHDHEATRRAIARAIDIPVIEAKAEPRQRWKPTPALPKAVTNPCQATSPAGHDALLDVPFEADGMTPPQTPIYYDDVPF